MSPKIQKFINENGENGEAFVELALKNYVKKIKGNPFMFLVRIGDTNAPTLAKRWQSIDEQN